MNPAWYDLLLLLVTFAWGSTFVLVKQAVGEIDVFSFLGIRFLLAALLLAAALGTRWRRCDRRTVARGAALGTFLFLSYAFQTVGLTLTSASSAAFITGLSVVMVPVLSALAFRQYPPRGVAVGVGMATAGLWLMSGAGSGGNLEGDLLVLVCAFMVAVHILLTGRWASRSDPYLLAAVQLGTTAAWGLGAMLLLPGRRLSFAPVVLWAWGITVVFATIFAFVVQTAAQRTVSASRTALIFTMEPVFGALFAWAFGGEVLGPAGLLGGALIVGGMVVTELTPRAPAELAESPPGGPSDGS
jgi:drug/metabolite transporter (DMT)-like permease